MKKRMSAVLLALGILAGGLTLPAAAETHTETVRGMLDGGYVDYMEITNVLSVGSYPYEITEIPVYYTAPGCRVTVLRALEPGDYPYTGKFLPGDGGSFDYDPDALAEVASVASFTDPGNNTPYILPGSLYDLTDGTWFFGDSDPDESFLVVVNGTEVGGESDGAGEIPSGDPAETVAGFTDVPAGEYYAEPVAWAVERGITNGTSAATFSPQDSCTRGQIITFLWRAAGTPEPGWTGYFPDVPADTYYTKAVAWAVETGIVPVTGAFSPDADCTRAMVAEFLWRYAGSPGVAAEVPFTDVPSWETYATAVAWALERGITTGTSATTFSPGQSCTRGQIVTFLSRAFA